MDEKLTDELIEAILSPLEAAEARSLALVRALVETGTISEEKLKPFLDQAENASEVKTRGLRIRLKRLLADVVRKAESDRKAEDDKKADSDKPQEGAEKKAEGPQVDPKEEAREHQKAAPARQEQETSQQSESQQDNSSEKARQQETTAPKEENVA